MAGAAAPDVVDAPDMARMVFFFEGDTQTALPDTSRIHAFLRQLGAVWVRRWDGRERSARG